jgi:hypothetical protein
MHWDEACNPEGRCRRHYKDKEIESPPDMEKGQKERAKQKSEAESERSMRRWKGT